jgi:hypothetical protein
MRRFELLIVVIVGLTLGAGTTFFIRRQESIRTAEASAAGPSFVSAGPDSGIQEAAVFIGASWCRGAAYPNLRDSLPILMEALRTEANSRNHRFTTIGVSLDGSAETGVEWLTKYGAFDELDVGGGWGNYAVLSLIWSDSSSSPILPQLVILTRQITSESPRKMHVGSVLVRERFYGAGPILRRLAPARKPTAG